ncbi:hypothetical protein VHA_001128 [Grimontia hollisae CIP 101886]|uniref:Uncharacterized protein n=1 Tax=Grimontia hollisae CIP 101886 TaxID=675812 RepID=D0I5W1_GRIHO|nr:hypothetical protein VHA_001128 [Grimontia hollisae CIP 101886]
MKLSFRQGRLFGVVIGMVIGSALGKYSRKLALSCHTNPP